ncbi:MAG: amidohydrolase, partial [Candidatus Heimdallarchaeota archaeon]|nr:amidohydrolase [Candidatus Heimdallarchaeota archaeon]MCK4876379.1 amidohydrolase [Candidatus Heimdallarchaeota archaeon]
MEGKIHATLVIQNANVWTLDKDNKKLETIAIYSDHIVRVGDKEQIKQLIGKDTIIIDAEDNTVIPGFIDAHTHIPWTGLNKVYLDLRKVKNLNEALELVESEIKKKSPGEWIIGRAWDQSNWPEQRYILAKDLDPISPDNPVILRHVSGHMVSVNSLGFQRLELSKQQLGVDLDEEGNITGTLRDVELSDKKEIRPTFDDFIKGITMGMEEAIELGITSIHDNITFESMPVYLHLIDNNQLKLRVYGIIYEDMIDEIIKVGIDRNFGDKWFKIGACKLMTDGAISSRSASVYEDYNDKEGEKGFALYDKKQLDDMITKVHNANLQIAAHAIGDRAITDVIESIEKNIDEEECRHALHRIEHAELLRKEDVERSKKLNLVFSMQPNFVWRWGLVGVNSMYEQRLGKERTMLNNPFRWVLDNDLIVAFGSDGMPLGPLYGIKGALFHSNPELRLTLEEAMKCYTIYPAITAREEHIKGTIEPGKLADLVILSHNLDDIKLEEFHDVDILYTILGGEIAYKKNK